MKRLYCLLKNHLKLAFLHYSLYLGSSKHFLFNIHSGLEKLIILYFCFKAVVFLIIILFCPLPQFAVECLSIFLGQTEHVPSGKPTRSAAFLAHPLLQHASRCLSLLLSRPRSHAAVSDAELVPFCF